MNQVKNNLTTKGDRLQWATSKEVIRVRFNENTKAEKLTEKELSAIRQSKGKHLIP